MLLATSAMATPAMAQDATDAPSGPITVSGGVDLVSDYRFRGISLSNEKVEVQPTITLTHESGFYAGVWGSGLPKTDEYGKVEVDLYAGWGGEVAPGTSVDIGATYYWYPDGKDAFGPVDYVEIIGKLSHDMRAGAGRRLSRLDGRRHVRGRADDLRHPLCRYRHQEIGYPGGRYAVRSDRGFQTWRRLLTPSRLLLG